MKFSFLLYILLLSIPAISRAQLKEDFSDGNFSDNPAWSGNSADWVISNGQLQSNSSLASTSFYLSTPSAIAAHAQWEFSVNLQFNTSGTNYIDVFLISDIADLKGAANGYFIRIGGTKDEVCLYKKVAGTTAPVLLINGTDGITNKSNNTLKIKVVRSAEHVWNLQRDVTGAGSSFISEGTSSDNTFTSGAFFGVVVQQSTSGFFKKHFFDNFQISEIDITPPQVSAVHVHGANALEVVFSEPVSMATAQDIVNYSVNNNVFHPASATIHSTDPFSVLVTFAAEFISTQPYVITVTGVEDLNNNAIHTPQTFDFTYVAPFAPAFRDIVINEMMADPSPVVDMPDQEFVELYNATDENIDLTGFTFTDGTSTATFGAVNFPPHSYLIICNTTHASLFSALGQVAGVSSFPSLNNSGETLTLKNARGKVIDTITYALSWYKDAVKDDGGWTLEQINPHTACNNAGNWQASIDPAGGTPGKQNSVYSNAADQTPPMLISVQTIAANTIQLNFNEAMDSLLLKSGGYNFDNVLNATTIQGIGPEYTAVQIIFSTPLEPGSVYQVKIAAVTDCAGNALAGNTINFGIGTGPKFNELLITEIMADESPVVGLPEAEFIELYNPTDKILSLDGITFSDATAVVKLPDRVIMPKEYLLLCTPAAVPLFASFVNTMGVSGLSLNNSGEMLSLRSREGNLIFSVAYASAWYQNAAKAEGGWSLEMIDPANPCGEENNWIASENPAGGTPGKINAVNTAKPDLAAPQLIRVDAENATSLLLSFNEKVDSTAAATIQSYQIDKNVQILSAHVLSPGFKQVRLNLTNTLIAGELYTVTINHLKDCSSNISSMQSLSFALPEAGDSLDILINEVLFNPGSGGVDFVEIYNNSAKYVSLKDWALANMDDEKVANRKALSVTNQVLPPKSYLVLTTNGKIIKDHYPKSKEETFSILPSLPGYPDESGTVILVNHADKVIDQFDYSEKYHFALIDDVNGVSLERIQFNSPTNNQNSWHSAASTHGYATPGYENSQQSVAAATASGLIISPKVFTPDEDGYEDFTQLNYSFAQSGNVATISIFDAQGREVKNIARNELLATEGFYLWDGINEQGEKVRSGRYIVLFTLFDMKGKQQIFKESVVVGNKFR